MNPEDPQMLDEIDRAKIRIEQTAPIKVDGFGGIEQTVQRKTGSVLEEIIERIAQNPEFKDVPAKVVIEKMIKGLRELVNGNELPVALLILLTEERERNNKRD